MGNIGAGWLFMAVAFPEGKRPNWTCGAANDRMTRVQRSEIDHNSNIPCRASNANSSVQKISPAAQRTMSTADR